MSTTSQVVPSPPGLPATAGRGTARLALSQAAGQVARQATNQGIKQFAKAASKGAANPAFIAADLLEYGVEHATRNKPLAKGSSLVAYAGIGAACGGPPGAAIGAVSWGFSQLVGSLF